MKNIPIPTIALFILSRAIIVTLTVVDMTKNPWAYRILGAFAASGLSVVIPGTISIKNDSSSKFTSLAEKSPTLTATGAMAVFVLVYLVNPS